MAGTRTAPTFTAVPPFLRLTIHLVDASGDNFTDSTLINPAASDAEIEAIIAQYQASTQASVYKVTTQGEYTGDEDPDNAETDQRNSVKQGINLLMKNTANMGTFTPRVVAPIPAILQGNQDIPLLVSPLTDLVTAMLAVQPGTVGLTSMQYTERRERSNNPRVKV